MDRKIDTRDLKNLSTFSSKIFSPVIAPRSELRSLCGADWARSLGVRGQWSAHHQPGNISPTHHRQQGELSEVAKQQ